MAWTAEHRRAADRRGLRYPSDLTDAEWAVVGPMIRPAKRGGRPRTVNIRSSTTLAVFPSEGASAVGSADIGLGAWEEQIGVR